MTSGGFRIVSDTLVIIIIIVTIKTEKNIKTSASARRISGKRGREALCANQGSLTVIRNGNIR